MGGGDLEVVYVSDGAINASKGTLGGLNGAVCQNFLMREDGSLEDLPGCADIILKPGENVASYCTGGGGYGPPYERPAEKVREDVEEKWITKSGPGRSTASPSTTRARWMRPKRRAEERG